VADGFVIDVVDLHKTYDGVEALRGVNLHVPKGSIYGFLGRNGAGKTTTMKVLLGMARPTGGHARVFGLAADDRIASVDIRRRAGFVSDSRDLYDYMTVGGMIRFTAPFFPRWSADLEQQYVRRFELPLERPVKALSVGMRTKLALLLALCRSAELLILDEPTAGLDPVVTEEVLQILVGHVASQETTVFLSSHQISEVDQVADHLSIIERGRTVVAGALDDLRQNFRRIQLVFDGDAPAVTFRAPGVMCVQRRGRVLTLMASAGVAQIVEEARAMHPVSVDVVPVTLKEIFLESVTGGGD
jgi:ABC-2 type transport system ATP-binding protein